MSELEIKDELIKEGYDVREVKHMKKKDANGMEIKTGGCIITFDNDELPDRIKLCGMSYRIRQYFPNPLVCGKCLKLGHIKAKCQSSFDICRKCGDTQEGMHNCSSPVCPNCPVDENNHEPNGKTAQPCNLNVWSSITR